MLPLACCYFWPIMQKGKLIRRSCSHNISEGAQPTSTLKLPQAGALIPLYLELELIEPETRLEGQEPSPIKPLPFIVELQLYADRKALFKQNPLSDSTLSWRHAIGRVPISSPAHFIFVHKVLYQARVECRLLEGSWHVGCLF